MRPASLALLLALGLVLPPALAGTLVELSAEASRPAANDLIRAVVFAEASGPDPAELAKRINQDIGEALRLIKTRPAVTVKSGNQQTFPVYGKSRQIESWRMRAELLLETPDSGAIAELLARLQQMKLALGNVAQMPSPATRREVEAAVTQDALKAFESRATLVARTLGRTYRIKRLNVQQAAPPAMPMLRSAPLAMAAELSPVPLEAGESLISTTVSGEIELAD
ncbi:MAG: SIMPL domain-containing protein [Bacteroidota bacterium]